MFTKLFLPRVRADFLVVFLSIFAGASVTLGQTYRGALQGTVLDESGAAVAAAQITIRGVGTSLERRAGGDGHGAFRVEDLPPGRYEIAVQAPGLARAASGVRLEVSVVRDLTVTLKPQSSQQSITVSGEASSIASQPMDVTSAV